MQPVQNMISSAGAPEQVRVPVHAAGRRPRTSSTDWAGKLEARHDAAARACSDVTSDLQLQQSGRSMIDIDREQGARAARHRRRPDARHASTAPSARAQIADIYTPSNDYKVILEIDAAVPARPASDLQHVSTCRAANGTLVPLERLRHARASGRAGDGQPPGPAAVGHDLVQSGAGHVARRGRRPRSTRSSARSTCRSPSATGFQGNRRRSSRNRSPAKGRCCCCRGPGDLYGARHPLRELHPPDHHPVRPAGGRLRARC